MPITARPVIQIDDPNVMEAIRAALRAAQADIVIDDDGKVVASYDSHVVRQENVYEMCDCLAWHLRFMKGNRDISPPVGLARKFFRSAREQHWFKQATRGPCPMCELHKLRHLNPEYELQFLRLEIAQARERAAHYGSARWEAEAKRLELQLRALQRSGAA